MDVDIWDILSKQKSPDELMQEMMEAAPDEVPKETYPRLRRTSVHYNYIPTAPRNLPYIRRAY